MNQHPSIRIANGDDAEAVAAIVAESFCELAVSQWLVPNSVVRQRVLTGNFHLVVENAIAANGTVYVADGTAAAVWFPGVPPEPSDYQTRLEAACAPYASQFRTLDSAFEKHHPTARSHHYLALLATRPGRRDSGLGSAFLNRHHAYLDGEQLPSYLEASDLKSARLYLRHGYRFLGHPFQLAEDGPWLWPMWREPMEAAPTEQDS